MALSQIQCLDDNHVNPRTHESKPEFFYSEDQRLALESLLLNGREAFVKFLRAHELRGFLSDPELDRFSETSEVYDPGSELCQADSGRDETPLSLQYWPELSDCSLPRLDLGWPDCAAYRGVTRVNVYAQPPLDGLTHIKEVVRKTIAQAQKVIAVVMDVFTDVDIFRDLLDAGFKRKVSVYILLERTELPHFLSMCERAGMHAGHLKNLRVRCTGGAVFYTRSCSRVCGRLGHRFMFVDGDKAISGSYSFTWTASRLDRHVVTMVTGQAVDSFDRLFRDLYLTSSSVNLATVTMQTEPLPEPLPKPAATPPPTAAIAKKLINPKYALVSLGNASSSPCSSHRDSVKNSISQDPPGVGNARKTVRQPEEAPPLHPGLANLERAYLIAYLPTWPEPDPASDVIGFINVRDASRPTQVHLQRSERFETSQAIRFSSPFSRPEPQPLPDKAQPRPANTHTSEPEPQLNPHSLNTHPSEPEPHLNPHSLNTHTSKPELHLNTHPSAPEPHLNPDSLHTHTSEPQPHLNPHSLNTHTSEPEPHLNPHSLHTHPSEPEPHLNPHISKPEPHLNLDRLNTHTSKPEPHHNPDTRVPNTGPDLASHAHTSLNTHTSKPEPHLNPDTRVPNTGPDPASHAHTSLNTHAPHLSAHSDPSHQTRAQRRPRGTSPAARRPPAPQNTPPPPVRLRPSPLSDAPNPEPPRRGPAPTQQPPPALLTRTALLHPHAATGPPPSPAVTTATETQPSAVPGSARPRPRSRSQSGATRARSWTAAGPRSDGGSTPTPRQSRRAAPPPVRVDPGPPAHGGARVPHGLPTGSAGSRPQQRGRDRDVDGVPARSPPDPEAGGVSPRTDPEEIHERCDSVGSGSRLDQVANGLHSGPEDQQLENTPHTAACGRGLQTSAERAAGRQGCLPAQVPFPCQPPRTLACPGCGGEGGQVHQPALRLQRNPNEAKRRTAREETGRGAADAPELPLQEVSVGAGWGEDQPEPGSATDNLPVPVRLPAQREAGSRSWRRARGRGEGRSGQGPVRPVLRQAVPAEEPQRPSEQRLRAEEGPSYTDQQGLRLGTLSDPGPHARL